MFGYEDFVFELEVLAARRAHPHHEPSIDDGVVCLWHEEHVKLGQVRVHSRWNKTTDQRPIGVVAAAGKRPPPTQPVSAVYADHFPSGHKTGGDQTVGRSAPDVLLGLAVKHPERRTVVRIDTL